MALEVIFLMMSFIQADVAPYNAYSADSIVRHYLEIGEIKKADEFSNVIKDNFLLGELSYFNCKFDEAVKLYTKVLPESDDANDAISRIIFIKKNKDAELKDYVNAELLGRQKRWDDAIVILKNLKNGKSVIASSASILLARLLEQKVDLHGALEEYQDFIERFNKDENLPQVWLKIGKIYSAMGRIEEARKAYQNILLKYPKSCVASIARELLENL